MLELISDTGDVFLKKSNRAVLANRDFSKIGNFFSKFFAFQNTYFLFTSHYVIKIMFLRTELSKNEKKKNISNKLKP